MSLDKYHGYIAALKQLEAEGGGVRKGWSTDQKTSLRNTYDELLTQWPWLEGFWIRWAESEYKLGSAERTLDVYRRALDKQHVPYSVTIWVSYLSFLTHVCHIGPTLPTQIQDLFVQASDAIGSHFLSHEFWDLYLEWSPDRVPLLLHILNDLTIHQYARYYAQLIRLVHAPTISVTAFESVVPNEVVHTTSNDEEQRLREVIISRLKLKYELQMRRVNAAYAYERRLKRPFFHPERLPAQELETWIAYIDNSSDPVPLYRRALIPAALDAGLWLKYLRYLRMQNAPKETIELAMEGAAGTKHSSLVLYYALWLELENNLDRAGELYTSLLSQPDIDAEALVQYSQFLARRGQRDAAKAELISGFQRVPSVAIISELSKFGDNTSTELDWPEDAENTELWRAKLAAFPSLADAIFNEAPEATITEEYLALVARTDAAKFLEVDRMVHRSALDIIK